MTQKSKGPAARSRRQFLAGGTAATAAAALAVAAGTGGTPAAPAAKAPSAEPGGYRLSEHVKRYYETTRT
jgi:hypothetical protein